MNRDLIGNLAWGGGIVALALADSFARREGYIDADMVNRIVLGATGLMIAWQGNRLPKTFVPSACGREARRVAGWSMALSGLVYAALWAFAPFQVALIGGCGAIILGMAVTFGYGFWLRGRARPA
ncbi:MAG: ammonium transporter [Brevundimonas sp.]|uniref:ammonium transporter n=1 Tax=Brevundimonas sp. TaxID=1871086 RepID=UPI003918D7BA